MACAASTRDDVSLRAVPPFRSKSEPLARLTPLLAGALPLCWYLAAAGSHGGFGQEGDFVAAARAFSVPFPPGAPVSSLVSGLFALLPVGPLAFRVSVASALCAALTLGLFARALLATLQHVGVHGARARCALALLGSYFLAQSPLFLQQAVRPQLFALQFALSMMVIDTLLRFESDEPHGNTRHLYFGAFVQGLCFANHHVYGLLMLPVAAPTLGRLFAHRGFMGLMGHVAAPMLGFSVFIYVPLRVGLGYGLGQASGLTRMLTMLSAEPYWGPSYRAPIDALAALQGGLFGASKAWLLGAALLAALGLWVTLRSSSRRRFGLLWLIALTLPLISVQFVLQPRLLMDAWGALLPSACAAIVFVCAGLGAVLDTLCALWPRAEPVWSGALAVAAAACLLTQQVAPSSAQAALVDQLDDMTRRQLSTRAVLFCDDASSSFRHLGREAEEALRPDITLVPLAQRNVPHVLDEWARDSPELNETLRDLVLTGTLSTSSLQSLSARRPVYVEPSDGLPAALYGTALDEGLLVRVQPDGVTGGDLRAERAAQAVRLGRLYHGQRSYRTVAADAAYAMGRAHFYQALLRVRLADPEGAHDYCELSLLNGFDDPRPARLKRELADKLRIDIGSYLTAEKSTLR